MISLYATVNVHLYIESLRVIDLIRRGIYNIRIKCYRENDSLYATPLPLVSDKLGEPSHNVKRPEIQHPNYCSKHFFIGYYKENVIIQNSCIFQIDLPLDNILNHNLLVEFEFIQHNEQDGATEEIIPEKVVCHQKLRINRAARGVQQYYPIIFGDWYFSILKVLVNTSIVNVGYKLNHQFNDLSSPSSTATTSSTSFSPSSPSIRESVMFSKTPPASNNYYNNKRLSGLSHSGSHLPTLSSSSPTSSSLMQSKSTSSLPVISPSIDVEIDQILSSRYSEVQSSLIECYCRLVERYKKLLLLLKQSQVTQLGDLVNVPALNIPPLVSWSWKSAIIKTNSSLSLQSLNDQPQQPPQQQIGQTTINNNNNNNISPSSSSPSASTSPSSSTSPAGSKKDKRRSYIKTSHGLLSDKHYEDEDNSFSSFSSFSTSSNTSGFSSTSSNSSGSGNNSAYNSLSSYDYALNISGCVGSYDSLSNISKSPPNHKNNNMSNSVDSLTITINGTSSPSSSSSSCPSTQELPLWKKMINNFQNIGQQISYLWECYCKIFAMVSREHCFKHAIQYETKCLKKWDHRVQRMTLHIQDINDLLLVLDNSNNSSSQFLSSYFQFKPFKIETIPIKLDTVYDSLPIFYEQKIKFHQTPAKPVAEADLIASSPPSITNSFEQNRLDEEITEDLNHKHLSHTKKFMLQITNNPGRHLFVFVHGLSGNSYDLRTFKNFFTVHFPNALYLICSSIEENTLLDIQQLGEKIAIEVNNFLHENSLFQITKISFVCHSLGGIVVRSALTSKHLKEHLSKLHSYVSLSSPHLGVKFYSGTIVPSALWLWQKFSSSTCLKQLLMQDANQLADTFLFKLSQSPTLHHFKYVFLVSSEQDGYVPYHSARIELPKESVKDVKNNVQKNILTQMIKNLIGDIQGKKIEFGIMDSSQQPIESIIKLNVVFEAHKGVDGVIGRSAHIRLLDQTWFMQMFVQLYKSYWE